MTGLWLVWSLITAAAAPVTLDEVLASADARAPVLAAAAAKVDEAEGKRLATRGAFDPVLGGKLGGYALEYPRTVAEASLAVRTPLGPSLEGGWSLGDGAFPAYDGDRETGAQGELWIAAAAPVLDGLGLGPERAAALVADAGVALAEADRDGARVSTRRKAAEAWWKWVAAGAKLTVEEELLAIALRRDAALAREVAEGARPRVEQLDNERVVLDRRAKVADATQDLEVAAQALSVWLRDADGRPRLPARDELPQLGVLEAGAAEGDASRAQVLTRPDLRAWDALIAAADVEVGRAANAMLPDLGVYGAALRDLADAQTELQAGATLKVPTLMRKERGERDRTLALRARLEAQRAQAADQAIAEWEAARAAVEATRQRVGWAERSESAATEVLALEERRFELGGGDLVQLLIREQNLAAARRSLVEARLDLGLAQAALEASIGALP